jgi:hypothetical protein
VEIEESDEEATEAPPATAVEPSGEPLHSLERLNKKEPPRATFTFTYSYDFICIYRCRYIYIFYIHIYIYTYTYTHTHKIYIDFVNVL